jgi:hypothetical protein
VCNEVDDKRAVSCRIPLVLFFLANSYDFTYLIEKTKPTRIKTKTAHTGTPTEKCIRPKDTDFNKRLLISNFSYLNKNSSRKLIAGKQKIKPIEIESSKSRFDGVLSKFEIRLAIPIELDLPSIREATENVRNFGKFKVLRSIIKPNATEKRTGPKT